MEGSPLYRQIYDHILSQIQSGQLEPGDRVPSEKELADDFQVSRITSKKALDLLCQDQIIERIQGKGSFISKSGRRPAEAAAPTEPAVPETSRFTLGVVLPEFADSYGAGIIRALEEQCRRHGAHLILKLTNDDSEREEQALSELEELGVDGFVVFPISGKHYNPKILELVVKDVPLVLVDRHLRGIPASSVSTDHRLATVEATQHLFALGHENIGFLSRPPVGTSAIEERLQGFYMAYSQRASKLTPGSMLTNLSGAFGGAEALERDCGRIAAFVERNPEMTAFVACEYSVAVALEYALQRLGRTIPEHYSVVCFDSPPSGIGQPRFTHIRQDEAEIGRTAVERIVEQLNGDQVPQHTFIGYALIEGRSTRSISQNRAE